MIFTILGKKVSGAYHKLITVLVVCNLDGTMSRLAAKCRAETVEKKLYSAGSQSTTLEISLMFCCIL